LRRTCAGERGYHTRGVSRACWASLSKQRHFRSESHPYSMWRDRRRRPEEWQPLDPPFPASEKVTRTSRHTTVYRVGIAFPLAFCLTDRSTIRDESPIERTTVGASKPVPATVRSGRLGWLPTLEKGRPKKPLILSMDDCQSSQSSLEQEVTRSTTRTAEHRRSKAQIK
jgi:hypothetical protein